MCKELYGAGSPRKPSLFYSFHGVFLSPSSEKDPEGEPEKHHGFQATKVVGFPEKFPPFPKRSQPALPAPVPARNLPVDSPWHRWKTTILVSPWKMWWRCATNGDTVAMCGLGTSGPERRSLGRCTDSPGHNSRSWHFQPILNWKQLSGHQVSYHVVFWGLLVYSTIQRELQLSIMHYYYYYYANKPT